MNIRAKRIFSAIEKSGYSYPELSKITGISKSSLQRYATGETQKIPIDCIEKIALATGTDSRYLMGWDDDISSSERKKPVLRIPGILHPVMRKIPLLGKTACGEPIYSPNYDDGYALLNEDYEADFALQAQGDSMTGAGIQSGDIVFFIAQETVDNGQIAAVFIDEEVTLKRVYYYKEKNKLILQPENPAYEPLVYVGEELNSIRIIGRAVAHLRRL